MKGELPTLREPIGIEDPHAPRLRRGLCHGCLAGEHERCIDDNEPSVRHRCVCQCSKLKPWPWACADDHPVLLLMANLQRSLEAACHTPTPS